MATPTFRDKYPYGMIGDIKAIEDIWSNIRSNQFIDIEMIECFEDDLVILFSQLRLNKEYRDEYRNNIFKEKE